MPTTNESSNTALANGGPAFPIADAHNAHDAALAALAGITDSAERDRIYTEVRARALQGMSLRVHAAVALRQPNSGIDWLDEMIRASQRDEFAMRAIQGFCTAHATLGWDAEQISASAYVTADAMTRGQSKADALGARAAFDVALNALHTYHSNWDHGLTAEYSESERLAMEGAVEAVSEALQEARDAIEV